MERDIIVVASLSAFIIILIPYTISLESLTWHISCIAQLTFYYDHHLCKAFDNPIIKFIAENNNGRSKSFYSFHH